MNTAYLLTVKINLPKISHREAMGSAMDEQLSIPLHTESWYRGTGKRPVELV